MISALDVSGKDLSMVVISTDSHGLPDVKYLDFSIFREKHTRLIRCIEVFCSAHILEIEPELLHFRSCIGMSELSCYELYRYTHPVHHTTSSL